MTYLRPRFLHVLLVWCKHPRRRLCKILGIAPPTKDDWEDK